MPPTGDRTQPPPGGAQAHVVVLHVRAPGPVPPHARQAALALLADAEPDAPWVRPQGAVLEDARGLELRLQVVADGPESAAAQVVDAVRALFGLDGAFARWVVAAREVEVRTPSGDRIRPRPDPDTPER